MRSSIFASTAGACALALALVACPTPASDPAGQTKTPEQPEPAMRETAVLTAGDRTFSSQHGFALSSSADGTVVATGAPYENGGGITDAGAATVFRLTGGTWTQTRLLASDAAATDWFGNSVAVSADGSTVAVGARYDDDDGADSGSVYIYLWDGAAWREANKITPVAGGNADDNFGEAVALNADGTRLVVGAPNFDEAGKSQRGIVYYCQGQSGWSAVAQTRIDASDSAAGQYFGKSVAIDAGGNRFVVAATGDGTKGAMAGAAYVYDWSGSSWDETKLYAPDAKADDRFGKSLALNGAGTDLMVGAQQGSGTVDKTGAAYVFSRNGSAWTGAKLLTDQNLAADDYLGASVAVSGDGRAVLVGAPGDDLKGSSAGCAYLLRQVGGSWIPTAVRASDGETPDAFGLCVAMNEAGTRYFVAAPLTDDRRGSVYVYEWR